MEGGPDVRAELKYANQFQIGYNRYELVLDFGQSFDGHPTTVWPIVLGLAQAQELCTILTETLDQYRQNYGPIPPMEGR